MITIVILEFFFFSSNVKECLYTYDTAEVRLQKSKTAASS